jgi:hypothetical protein
MVQSRRAAYDERNWGVVMVTCDSNCFTCFVMGQDIVEQLSGTSVGTTGTTV